MSIATYPERSLPAPAIDAVASADAEEAGRQAEQRALMHKFLVSAGVSCRWSFEAA